MSEAEFTEKFSEENIKQHYLDRIKYTAAPGVDCINKRLFERRLTYYIDIIRKKVLAGEYEFTPYRESLIIKNREKPPRMISVPTIRDRVTLGVLRTYIQDKFPEIQHRNVQPIIQDIKQSISQYEHMIKLDIKNFYPSINHELLLKKVRTKIKTRNVLRLIKNAITTPTVPEGSRTKEVYKKGVPQGLPISNLLSSIYLKELDDKYSQKQGIKYYRYVDDILILCKSSEAGKLLEEISTDIKKFKLKLNPDKVDSKQISLELSYLGYSFTGDLVSVRRPSIMKLEKSLEQIFIDFKNSGHKRLPYFLWKLNLRITGCRDDKKKYGWMFFFSQITDLRILFHLDWYLQKLIKRFELDKKLRGQTIKRFTRTYHEILKNLDNTRYIPDFNSYSIFEKEAFLRKIEVDLQVWDDQHIERAFSRIIFSSIRELERDIQNLKDRY